MMTSSGLDSYRGGGSLSYSNLSALAPPFKVDKSLPGLNSENPAVIFSDVPVYGAFFDPAGPFYDSSSSFASGQKFAATEPIGTSTTCPSSPSIYGYPGLQSSTLSTGMYYGSTSTVASYDLFSYNSFPNSMSTNVDVPAKPYYPPYASPPSQKDGYSGLGVGSKSGYDLLSNSGSAHLSGYGSAHVVEPQVLSGHGEYKLKWSGLWSGLNEAEHGKWTDYAQGTGSKDLSLSDSSSNKSRPFVDGSNKSHPFVDGSNNFHLVGDGSNKNHPEQGASVALDFHSHGEVSTLSNNCFDIFDGAYSPGNLGLDQQSCKTLLERSRMPISVSSSVSKETPHLQEPVLESVTNFSGSQKANGSSPEEQFSQTGISAFACTSATGTFPIAVTKLSYDGGSSSVENTLSALKLNSMASDAANQSNTSVGCSSPHEKSLGLNCQSSIIIGRPVSTSMVVSSSKIGDTADSRLHDKKASDKMKFAPQVPHQFSSDGFNLESSDTEAVYPLEKHSGASDIHNPAEDSPCWRGASSNHFAPFRDSEGAASDALVKMLDRCKSLSTQDTHRKSLLVDTFNPRDFSSGKMNENTLSERPSVSNYTSIDNEDCSFTNPKSCCFDLNTRSSAVDCHVFAKEYNMPNKSRTNSDTKSSLAMQQNLKGGEMSSARNMSEAPASERIGNSAAMALDSGVPSPPEGKASLKDWQSPSADSDSRIDVNVLLKTMTKLSEIVRCYCFSTRPELAEKQSSSIKQIVNNLNASMLMAEQTTRTMMLSARGTSFPKELPVDQIANDAEEIAAAVKLGRTAEDFLDYVSFKDGANMLEDSSMTEAVSKFLHENLHEEDEMDQQKCLYKNLWLEAEASLCVMSAKARFHRMKTEMEKTHDGTKDKNPPSPKFSANVHRVELATEGNDSPALGECPKSSMSSQRNQDEAPAMNKFPAPNPQVVSFNSTELEGLKSMKKESCLLSLHASRPGAYGNDSYGSGTTGHANDLESSVMGRYQILRSRVENSDSLNCEGKQSSGECEDPSISYDSGNESHARGTASDTNEVEPSVLAKYLILKNRGDNSVSLNYEGKQLRGEENNSPDEDSLSPYTQFQNSELSNSIIGLADEGEASVMARLRIILNRVNHSNSVNKNPTPGQANAREVEVEGGTEESGMSQEKKNALRRMFGPYPDFSMDQDVNMLGSSLDLGLGLPLDVKGEAFAPSCNTKGMICSEIFEGWCDKDCSSSDWEHVSKGDL